MSPKKPIPDDVPGPDVQPTGLGGSYLIDPATGRPVAAPSVPASPPVVVAPSAPEPVAETAHPAKKETGK